MKAPRELPRVLVDFREKLPWRFSSAVTVETGVNLPTSDYSLGGATELVAIERKSIADLVQSCASKERERFWECMRRLSLYTHKALIVEGSMADVLAGAYRSMASPQSVIATTLAMQIDLGVGVVWAGDRTEAAKCCEWMLVRVWKRLQANKDELRKAAAKPCGTCGGTRVVPTVDIHGSVASNEECPDCETGDDESTLKGGRDEQTSG